MKERRRLWRTCLVFESLLALLSRGTAPLESRDAIIHRQVVSYFMSYLIRLMQELTNFPDQIISLLAERGSFVLAFVHVP